MKTTIEQIKKEIHFSKNYWTYKIKNKKYNTIEKLENKLKELEKEV